MTYGHLQATAGVDQAETGCPSGMRGRELRDTFVRGAWYKAPRRFWRWPAEATGFGIRSASPPNPGPGSPITADGRANNGAGLNCGGAVR